MHIPDGYLSPQTYAPIWVVMGGYWAVAFKRMRDKLPAARLPLIAIGSAFSFVVMMFNVPVPGGTTGHAVGAGLLAILLGPWAASIAISVAVVVQALLFGDGGVTAIAANCLTMAVIGPWVAWYGYRLVAGRSELSSWRRIVAGGVGAYLGINASAFVTAVLFGIQPAIAHTASGQPLYAPYPLWVAVPAMMIEHLAFFGVVEAAVTAAAVAWLQRVDLPLLAGAAIQRTAAASVTVGPGSAAPPGRYRLLWIALAVMVLLTPLGLWIPAYFGAGTAWGEWSGKQLQATLGYAPAGLVRLQSQWNAALPGYSIPGLGGPGGAAIGYILAGAAGVALVAGVGFGVAWLARRSGSPGPAGTSKEVQGRPSATAAAPLGSHAEPLPTPLPVDRRSRTDFVGRTIAALGSETRRAMVAERSANAAGWLQHTDARAKIVAALALIVAASLVHTHWPLVMLYVVTLVAAVTSGVALGTTLKRVWLVVPLFSGLALLPATLNIITPGVPLVVLATLGPGAHLGPFALPPAITITLQGVSGASLALLRVVASVGVAAVLVATTRWQELLSGLRSLRVPTGFVMVTEMAYRYVFLLSGLARDDFLARRSRTIVESGGGGARRFVAGRATGLFRRSLSLAERVNQAMSSRGWTGEPRVLGEHRLGRRDIAFAAASVVFAAAIVAGSMVSL